MLTSVFILYISQFNLQWDEWMKIYCLFLKFLLLVPSNNRKPESGVAHTLKSINVVMVYYFPHKSLESKLWITVLPVDSKHNRNVDVKIGCDWKQHNRAERVRGLKSEVVCFCISCILFFRTSILYLQLFVILFVILLFLLFAGYDLFLYSLDVK